MSDVNAITTNAPIGGVKYQSVTLKEPESFEAKLRPIYTGVCGTDRGIVSGSLPFSYNPHGFDYLVLGHESLCQVVDIKSNDAGIKKGDYVVPIVRRPGNCVNCAIGRPDNCSDGDKHEAGITGLHGFMRDEFYEEISNLVRVSDSTMRDVAVLTEPTKNVVKAFEAFDVVSKRSVYAGRDSSLEEKKAVIVGTGSEGFLYSFMAKEYGFDTLIVNRHPIDDLKMEVINRMNGNFMDYSKEFDAVVKGGIDLLIDTSGNPSTIFQFLRRVNYNGIVILFGTNGKAPAAQVDGRDIDYIVERNITVMGSVDAAKKHYIQALEYLRKWKYVYGDALAKMITRKYMPDETIIFTEKPADEIKSVIKWA